VNYKKCTGCYLNSHRINQTCTIEVSAVISALFLGRINPNYQLNLNANYLDLICSTAVKHPTFTPSLPTISITNSAAFEIFNSSEATDKLISISHYNLSYHQLSFYTDGSVIDIGTNQCTMGIGWIQIDNNNQIINSYSAKIQSWPSSYKAELLSILSAISTAPCNSVIDIFTDSQSVISKFNNLQLNSTHPNKLFKFNSWPIWHTLLNIIKSFKLHITLHKVQAHSDNHLNEQADSLAKQHPLSPLLSFNHTNIYNLYFSLQWKQHYVELPTRYFIKQICKAYILAIWASQKQNSK